MLSTGSDTETELSSSSSNEPNQQKKVTMFWQVEKITAVVSSTVIQC
jgi:hypothetical protein